MKRAFMFALACALSAGTAFAAPFDEFKFMTDPLAVTGEIAQKNLDNFARDMGMLLGGGSFHQGKSLGIPGFDVGIHVPAKKVNADNAVVKAAGVDTILLPVLQAEIGLPAKIDLLARYSAYENVTMVGGGVRYGIFKAGLPGLPSLSVQAMYNTLDANAGVNKFKAATMSAGAVLSFNLPVINPYLGAGFDSTTVEPDASLASGLKGTASGYRVEAGVNLGLLPFTYLQLGGAYLNGDIGYTAGLGLQF